jgi:hypothetical protein
MKNRAKGERKPKDLTKNKYRETNRMGKGANKPVKKQQP